MKKKIFILIIGILAILVLVMSLFTGFLVRKLSQKQTVEYITDTIRIKRTEYIPKPSTVYVPVAVHTVVDTAAIIADYFATRFYVDTLLSTNDFNVVLRDSVSENRIISRNFDIEYLKTQIIENQRTKNWQFGVGVYITNPIDRLHFDLAPT
jgi:hypothetical protein